MRGARRRRAPSLCERDRRGSVWWATNEVVGPMMSSSGMAKKLDGLDSISCVYPNCRSSAPVELFNVHLARCRRNWLGPNVTCSFNSAHVLPAPEERYHQLTCQDRWLKDELSECKEKLPDVEKSSMTRSGSGAAKKPGYEASGVRGGGRGQASYFYRGGSYSKWRNVGPRLQNKHAKQYEDDLYEADPRPGRGRAMAMKWERSSVTGFRGGHRPSRGLAFVAYRAREEKTPTGPTVAIDDDLPSQPIARGFSPWASYKQRSPLADAVRMARWRHANK